MRIAKSTLMLSDGTPKGARVSLLLWQLLHPPASPISSSLKIPSRSFSPTKSRTDCCFWYNTLPYREDCLYMVLSGTKEGISLTMCAWAAKADSNVGNSTHKAVLASATFQTFLARTCVSCHNRLPSLPFVWLLEISEFQGLLFCFSFLQEGTKKYFLPFSCLTLFSEKIVEIKTVQLQILSFFNDF